MTDICCIGHITLDKIITPHSTASLNGGTSYYFSYGISRMPGVSYKLVTSLAEADMQAVADMRAAGIDVEVIPSRHTVFFENSYGENMNNRRQRVLAKADPFTAQKLSGVEARYIHLGSLLADDFPLDAIESLAGRGTLSVDAQGFLRYVDGDKVYPCDWEQKRQVLQMVDILKVNEHEIESLTGYSDLEPAARVLAGWGVKEVLMTLGSYGSVIYADGQMHRIPAYRPKQLVDATGCGDTYATGYLYMRSRGAAYDEAGRFAAAMATLNLEKTGAFCGTEADVEAVLSRGE
ncbi:MAG: PfkB family carbohydrate kinase [Bacteroidales bacterium]|nr:PfkB family carbohydrate kinase [Bacteroidales bacterium]MDY3913311.1 PfkB family carbohydrate kinase [Sodaliphilus sp.]